MIRRVVFWMHLGSAVTIGTVILILSVSGTLLTYERQLLERAERAYFVDPPGDRGPLTVEALVDAAQRVTSPETDQGFAATAVVVRSDPRAAVQVRAGRTTRIYVDAYSGEPRGAGFPRLEGFFERVRGWHRWLNAATPLVRRGRAVTGAANLVFLFMVLSGLFLWIPRRWSRTRVRAVLFFRRRVRGRARDFNWHNVVGFWSALPLLGIIATATVTSYPSLADRVYPKVGGLVPDRGLPSLPSSDRRPTSAGVQGDLTAALETARSSVRDWRRIVLTLPSERADIISLRIDAGYEGQPQRSGTLTIDRATGVPREWRTFGDLGPQRRAQEFLRYAHTGEYWGLFGQTLAGLFSLAAVLMVWTGLSLALRRLKRALRRRSARVHGAA